MIRTRPGIFQPARSLFLDVQRPTLKFQPTSEAFTLSFRRP